MELERSEEMSVKDMVYDHERRITVMSKALHCLKLEVRDLEDWIREKNKIVRCKDCKYWEVDNDVGFCVRTEECDWTADDFCSRGVRR